MRHTDGIHCPGAAGGYLEGKKQPGAEEDWGPGGGRPGGAWTQKNPDIRTGNPRRKISQPCPWRVQEGGAGTTVGMGCTHVPSELLLLVLPSVDSRLPWRVTRLRISTAMPVSVLRRMLLRSFLVAPSVTPPRKHRKGTRSDRRRGFGERAAKATSREGAGWAGLELEAGAQVSWGCRVGGSPGGDQPCSPHSASSLPGSLMATFPTQFQPLPQMVSFLFWKVCFLWHSQICFPPYPHEPYHTQTSQSTSDSDSFTEPIKNPM